MDGVGGHNIVDHNIFMDIITVWPLNIFPITYNLQKNKENKNKVGTDITLSYLMHCNSHNYLQIWGRIIPESKLM